MSQTMFAGMLDHGYRARYTHDASLPGTSREAAFSVPAWKLTRVE